MSSNEQEMFSSTNPESSFANDDWNPLAELFPEEYRELNLQDSLMFPLPATTSAPDPGVATNKEDSMAHIAQLMTDVGLGENWEYATMADIPAGVPMPNFDDADFLARLGAASPEPFQFMPSPSHPTDGDDNNGDDNNGDLDLALPEPGKRSRGRPKKAEGAPKGPYKKRGAPAPPPIRPVKPKRAYRKRIAAPADLTTIRVATADTVREGVKVPGWYTKTDDGLYKNSPPNRDS